MKFLLAGSIKHFFFSFFFFLKKSNISKKKMVFNFAEQKPYFWKQVAFQQKIFSFLKSWVLVTAAIPTTCKTWTEPYTQPLGYDSPHTLCRCLHLYEQSDCQCGKEHFAPSWVHTDGKVCMRCQELANRLPQLPFLLPVLGPEHAFRHFLSVSKRRLGDAEYFVTSRTPVPACGLRADFSWV